MSRRRQGVRAVVAWLAMGLLPLALCLAMSYGLSLYHFRSEARKLAEANAHRVTDILRSGEALLAELARSTRGECTPKTIAAMSQAVFHGVYFREAGIERDGDLLCTSLEMLPPGFSIQNSKRTPAARIGAMEILSPTKTIRGGKSLILNWPLRADRTHYVNLLLDPQVLVENSRQYEGLVGTTFLDDRPNGELFRFDGGVPLDAVARLRTPIVPGVYGSDDGVYAVARSGPYPVFSAMSVSSRLIEQHWRTQMQPAVIAGFLLSGLAFLLLRRYLPRLDAIQDLRAGLAAHEIRLDYQPILDGRDRRIIGAEALARWHHPKRGLVMPDEFIPLAESSGLISPLTGRVLEQVKRDLETLGELPPGFRISVNLARAQLADKSLLECLDKLFGPGATLARLAFEITERELIANVAENARIVVEELALRGAEVSLDDFGTGYSGLSHLRHMPLHYLKIDRSFVRALNTEAVTASLVESIVSMARSLGMGLIAEGVETEQQRERLLALGVHLHQGWLYAKASPLEDLLASLGRQAAAGTPA